jgi:hypothetical protein
VGHGAQIRGYQGSEGEIPWISERREVVADGNRRRLP